MSQSAAAEEITVARPVKDEVWRNRWGWHCKVTGENPADHFRYTAILKGGREYEGIFEMSDVEDGSIVRLDESPTETP
jgi:hypothetical protein